MKHIDDTEAMEHLRQAGWTSLEIERLRQFRQTYAQKGERTLRDHQRPAFVRRLLLLLLEGFPPSRPW
jgi:type II secretory pathway component PulF